MGMVCSDGVLLAADSRASAGSTIVIRDMNKITPVTPDIFVCHSGTASSTQALARFVKFYIGALQINAAETKRPKVAIVAQVLRKIIQNNKDYLSAQMIVGGFDDEGPHIFAVMQSGMAVERVFAAGGSGSMFITSYCDEYFRAGMTLQEASDFALKAVNHATVRDGYSGGPINIVSIKDGSSDRKWYNPDKQPINSSIIKT
jgi:20S proteasome subunit beta 1